MEKISFNVFSKYVEDNKPVLTGIGIIATIAALFLNLDQSVFGDSLRSLQLLLLLFLILGLIFLTINSLFWFKENADSWFAGLVVFTLGLTVWRIWEFVLNNFRGELNQYLLLIIFSVTFVVGSFLNKRKKKAETNIDNKFTGALSKALMYGLASFIFLYAFNTILGFYSDFALGKELSATKFLSPLSKTFIWTMAIWIAVADFCISFFFNKERARLWLSILLLTCLAGSLLVILWQIGADLFMIFKK